ncbi:MAG: hypothetical protein AB7O65_13230 [Candidatus Korobacteraceae bacterium]
MSRIYRAGDRVFAFSDRPELVLSLTCLEPETWGVTVFDFTEKKATLTDHTERSLEDAKRFVGKFASERYGADISQLVWREALTIRPSGPSG